MRALHKCLKSHMTVLRIDKQLLSILRIRSKSVLLMIICTVTENYHNSCDLLHKYSQNTISIINISCMIVSQETFCGTHNTCKSLAQ